MSKKILSEERETVVEAREIEIHMAEESWKIKEKEMERRFRRRLKQEVEEEVRQEVSASTPIHSRMSKQEDRLMPPKKDGEYKSSHSLEKTDSWREADGTVLKYEQREKIEDCGTKPKLRFSTDQKEVRYVGHKDAE